MSFETYKVMHLVGVILLFLALGGLLARPADAAATQAPDEPDEPGEKGVGAPVDVPAAPRTEAAGGLPRNLLAALQGVALLVVLVAGFGALAKLKLKPIPGWIWAKVALWVVIAASPALIKRKPELAKGTLFLLAGLGAAAAYLAVGKPF